MVRPDDLVDVFSTNNANDAELLRMALHGEGIQCEIGGESQGGFTGIDAMKIQLLVRAEDYDRATAFLKKHPHRKSDRQ